MDFFRFKVTSLAQRIDCMNNVSPTINETKSGFFEKINNLDQPLSNLTKAQRKYPN